MTNWRRALMSGSVLFVALAIGHVMEHGAEIDAQFGAVQAEPAANLSEITAVEDIKAGQDLPKDPLLTVPVRPLAPVTLAPSGTSNLPERLSEQNARSRFGFACDVEAQATPSLGAMVTLELTAPCYGGATVTVIHNDLRASLVTSPEGRLRVDVPALVTDAQYRMRFGDGVEVTAAADVPDAELYDQVTLSWQGDLPLGLHAFEFGAEVGTTGHVHVGQPYVAGRATHLRRGFLTRLGEGGAEDWRTEVFSFPTQTARKSGLIDIMVTAEATETTCDTQLRALTSRHSEGREVGAAAEILMSLPDCGTSSDVLELKNLVPALKVAGN